MKADACRAGKMIMAWSGGKDSAMALYEIRKGGCDVMALLTTISDEYARISMHGVRIELVEEQAKAAGLPLRIVRVKASQTNEAYEAAMREALLEYKSAGVETVAFGDIFLEDLKKYREEKLELVGMKGAFPIWKRDTADGAREFIRAGFKAILTCVDGNALDGSFAGAEFNTEFLSRLPASVDPCGENGEFHTFVYDGPIFSRTIPVERGEVVVREGRFHYCDLVLSA